MNLKHTRWTATAVAALLLLAAPVATAGPKACNDGMDNDGDGLIDYPNDPGCSSRNDNNETNPTPACSDGMDNDGDGFVDYPADPGCTSASDNDEYNAPPPPACSDGVDNDGDGFVDYPADPGCTSASDNDEYNAPPPPTSAQACSDGMDNDGDGFVDYPADRGCSSATDNTENDAAPPAAPPLSPSELVTGPFCGISFCTPKPGPGTHALLSWTGQASRWAQDKAGAPPIPPVSTAQVIGWVVNAVNNATTHTSGQACSDGIDNDGDGYADFPWDPGCSSASDTDETDPQGPPPELVQPSNVTVQWCAFMIAFCNPKPPVVTGVPGGHEVANWAIQTVQWVRSN